MSYEFTDAMTILDMLFEYEEYMIRRKHSKNTRDGDWPSESEIHDEAESVINSYSNTELLRQMQFVLDERKNQRERREKEKLSVQAG
ncbi:hypothetical protein HWB57_gp162 [Erwinia phage vB_EamM-Bue1]|uniref:Uncharacterized protein n=1 Tax=Erwinia phage vB_EamM-Bue1 TaxID=2099338 RepID=A0A2P1JUI2_9CAUD|nr:hypothetical protein HWB57_gp162 [Erwinia phage vB_EamM-Bue1]AVO23010.1 hypothetical protein [Erwinia phage vB_EamM-Bue1]